VRYTRPKWLYTLIAVFLLTIPIVGPGLYLKTHLVTLLNQNALFRYAVRNMTESQKKEYYATLAQQLPSSTWEAVPEPLKAACCNSTSTKCPSEPRLSPTRRGYAVLSVRAERPAAFSYRLPRGLHGHGYGWESGAMPTGDTSAPAVEVMLRTEAYWTTIDNFTMQSYRLIAAWQE
jgi:hypothetical protein